MYALLGRANISNDEELNWIFRAIVEITVNDESNIALLFISHPIIFTNFIQPAFLPTFSEAMSYNPDILAKTGDDKDSEELEQPKIFCERKSLNDSCHGNFI